MRCQVGDGPFGFRPFLEVAAVRVKARVVGRRYCSCAARWPDAVEPRGDGPDMWTTDGTDSTRHGPSRWVRAKRVSRRPDASFTPTSPASTVCLPKRRGRTSGRPRGGTGRASGRRGPDRVRASSSSPQALGRSQGGLPRAQGPAIVLGSSRAVQRLNSSGSRSRSFSSVSPFGGVTGTP